jgi:hypothetical protein
MSAANLKTPSTAPAPHAAQGIKRRKTAAAYLDMGVDHFDREVRPHVPVVRFGGERYWRVVDLDKLVAERLEDPQTGEAER